MQSTLAKFEWRLFDFFQPKLLLRHHFWGRTKVGREVRILGSHAVSIWGVMLCDRLFKDMIWAPPPRPVLSFEQILNQAVEILKNTVSVSTMEICEMASGCWTCSGSEWCITYRVVHLRLCPTFFISCENTTFGITRSRKACPSKPVLSNRWY